MNACIDDVLSRCDAAAIRLRLDGAQLLAEPRELLTDELRSLIRANKDGIVAALRRPLLDATDGYETAIEIERMHICRPCAHFSARPARQPDGYCHVHDCPTWAAVPFECPDFKGKAP